MSPSPFVQVEGSMGVTYLLTLFKFNILIVGPSLLSGAGLVPRGQFDSLYPFFEVETL